MWLFPQNNGDLSISVQDKGRCDSVSILSFASRNSSAFSSDQQSRPDGFGHLPDPFLNADLSLKSEHAGDFIERDFDIPHVAVEVEVLVFNFEAGDAFADEAGNFFLRIISPIGPDIEDLPPDFIDRRIEGEHDGPDDVPNMDEGAIIFFLIKDEFLGADRLLDELVDDEVKTGSGRGAEECREAVDDGRAARPRAPVEQVSLGGDLCLGIEGLRIKWGVLRHGPAVLGDAVVAVGGGKHETAGAVPFGQLEDISRAVEIAGERGTFAQLGAGRIADDGREMDNVIDALKIFRDPLLVTDIGFVEGERGVIEIGEERVPAEEKIIEHGDLVAAPKQFSTEERPDIARAAGYEDVGFFHGGHILWGHVL